MSLSDGESWHFTTPLQLKSAHERHVSACLIKTFSLCVWGCFLIMSLCAFQVYFSACVNSLWQKNSNPQFHNSWEMEVDGGGSQQTIQFSFEPMSRQSALQAALIAWITARFVFFFICGLVCLKSGLETNFLGHRRPCDTQITQSCKHCTLVINSINHTQTW